MIPRFNCRSDNYNEYMFEAEGGEYVKAEDYDKLCNFLMGCVNRFTTTADATQELVNDIEHVALNGI